MGIEERKERTKEKTEEGELRMKRRFKGRRSRLKIWRMTRRMKTG